MDRRVLVSAVGFRPLMITPVVDVMAPEEIVLIAGKHGQVVETEKEVTAHIKAKGIPLTVVHVDDWDIVQWNTALTAALDRLKDDSVTLNLTAGHGLCVAIFAIHAAKRALPVVCYDWEPLAKTGKQPKDLETLMHRHSPAAIFHLQDTQPVDRRILELLLVEAQNVTTLGAALQVPQSTLSTSLARLAERGFVDREASGRNKIYRLRPGLEPMISAALRR